MRNTLFLCLCCGFLLLFGACKKHVVSDPADLTEVQKALVKSDNELAFSVLRGINATGNTSNVLLSPPALGTSMGMLISGADGSTRSTLQQAMGLSALSSEDINQGYKDLSDRFLSIDDASIAFIQGNSLWYQSGVEIKPAYQQLNQLYYGAGIMGVNFQDSATRGTLNQWASVHTWDKVTALNPPIGADNKLMAASTAAFSAPFTTMFTASKNTLAGFNLPDGSTVPVSMMYEQNMPFGHYGDNMVDISDIPYGGGQFCLTIMLPKSGVSMAQLLESVTNEKWQLWMSSLDTFNIPLLHLPKVELSNPVSLETALNSTSMANALNSTASYTNLCGNGVKPDAILQGCYLKIEEHGANAAPEVLSVIPTPQRQALYINRPYLMAIREKSTGTILMLAQVNNPLGH